MRNRHDSNDAGNSRAKQSAFDHKLAAYLAATCSGSLLATETQAVIVSNSTVQPFGINGEVNIDFNSDGQIDFQIDHDRVNVNGTDLDYLQLDKNDINGATDPYPVDPFAVFPVPQGQGRNWDHGYLTAPEIQGDIGYYPAALLPDAEIGPSSTSWDFQEGDNFLGQHLTIRANRLIDEDATQIDAANPSPPPDSMGQQLPLGTPGWLGLGGQTRYLGVRLDLNDAGFAGNEFPTVNGPNNTDDPANYWYGWIGVRITHEGDATGEVVGWGYETDVGVSILAGETAPGLTGDFNGNGKVDAADYVVWRDSNGTQQEYDAWKANFGEMIGSGSLVIHDTTVQAVPEPSSLLLGLGIGLAVTGAFVWRRICRR